MKQCLFILSILLPLAAFAQIIQEICSTDPMNGTMVAATSYQDTIYATGFFTNVCGANTAHIAQWNGQAWESANWGISAPGHALTVIDNQLFVARYEQSIDSNWVQVYENGVVNRFGPGVYLSTASGNSQLPNIYDILNYEDRIIVCGEFDRVGTQTIHGIMEWNGSDWQGLGTGLQGNISNTAPVIFPHQLLEYEGDLLVAGNFREAGGVEVNGIARWDGATWSALGAGFNGTVYAMAVFQGELYAGGSFTLSGSTMIDHLAKWDGNSWVPVPFSLVSSSSSDFIFVHTLEVINDQLYVAGGIKRVAFPDGSTADAGGIIRFDGTTVEAFAGGVPNNDIEAIHPHEDRILIGGGVFGSGYVGLIDLDTSWEVISKPEPLQLHPNPAHDWVSWKGDLVPDELRVFNSLGQIVPISSAAPELEGLDISSWAPGVYYVWATVESVVHRGVLIKP